jgi:hypothetical protein
MLDIPTWVYELRGRAKMINKYKKRNKFENIIEELIKLGRHLTNSELILYVENSEIEDEHRKIFDLIYNMIDNSNI